MAEKIGIFFGSSTGATERIANMLKTEIEAASSATCDVQVVSAANLKELEKYKYLLLGCSTWNIGELQDDWGLVFPLLDTVNFRGKKIGYFGAGDQFGYSNSFVDAIGILCDKITALGGDPVGWTPVDESYQFEFSRGAHDHVFVGLAIDEDNQAALTQQRVVNWAYWILEEFGLYKPEAVPA